MISRSLKASGYFQLKSQANVLFAVAIVVLLWVSARGSFSAIHLPHLLNVLAPQRQDLRRVHFFHPNFAAFSPNAFRRRVLRVGFQANCNCKDAFFPRRFPSPAVSPPIEQSIALCKSTDEVCSALNASLDLTQPRSFLSRYPDRSHATKHVVATVDCLLSRQRPDISCTRELPDPSPCALDSSGCRHSEDSGRSVDSDGAPYLPAI
jgi:hypothetical protein